MELGAGLHLDPADPQTVHEHRRQAEPAALLLHHLGGGPDVGVEADTQVGELGVEGGTGDQAGVALGDQPPGGIAGQIVGHPLALHRLSDPPPRIDQARRLRRPRTTPAPPAPGGPPPAAPAAGRPSRLHGRAGWRGPGARAEAVQHPRGDRHPEEGGHRERHQQPPGVAAEPPVEHPGGDETGQGGGVAQPIEPLEPGDSSWDCSARWRHRPRPGWSPSPPAWRRPPARGPVRRCARRRRRARRAPPGPGADRWWCGGGGRPPGTARRPWPPWPPPSPGGCRTRFVGPGLADQPTLGGVQETAEGLAAGAGGRPCCARPRLRRVGPGQVEEVAGDDQEPGPLPGLQGPGQLTRVRP